MLTNKVPHEYNRLVYRQVSISSRGCCDFDRNSIAGYNVEAKRLSNNKTEQDIPQRKISLKS